jgi:hypothetical protein
MNGEDYMSIRVYGTLYECDAEVVEFIDELRERAVRAEAAIHAVFFQYYESARAFPADRMKDVLIALDYKYPSYTTPEDKSKFLIELEMELTAARERVARLAGAIEKLLACPCIADRDLEPAWLCSETAEAVAFARAALEDK